MTTGSGGQRVLIRAEKPALGRVSARTERAVDALQIDVPPGDPAAAQPATTRRTETPGGPADRCHLIGPALRGGGAAVALAATDWHPPGCHPEHPTAQEGCRSASRGLTLTLIT